MSGRLYGVGVGPGDSELLTLKAVRVEEKIQMSGAKVLMKAGKSLGKVKEMLSYTSQQAIMAENCGMENEHIYKTIEEIAEQAGYYSLLILKG